jgi:hypothetical protein
VKVFLVREHQLKCITWGVTKTTWNKKKTTLELLGTNFKFVFWNIGNSWYVLVTRMWYKSVVNTGDYILPTETTLQCLMCVCTLHVTKHDPVKVRCFLLDSVSSSVFCYSLMTLVLVFTRTVICLLSCKWRFELKFCYCLYVLIVVVLR